MSFATQGISVYTRLAFDLWKRSRPVIVLECSAARKATKLNDWSSRAQSFLYVQHALSRIGSTASLPAAAASNKPSCADVVRSGIAEALRALFDFSPNLANSSSLKCNPLRVICPVPLYDSSMGLDEFRCQSTGKLIDVEEVVKEALAGLELTSTDSSEHRVVDITLVRVVPDSQQLPAKPFLYRTFRQTRSSAGCLGLITVFATVWCYSVHSSHLPKAFSNLARLHLDLASLRVIGVPMARKRGSSKPDASLGPKVTFLFKSCPLVTPLPKSSQHFLVEPEEAMSSNDQVSSVCRLLKKRETALVCCFLVCFISFRT